MENKTIPEKILEQSDLSENQIKIVKAFMEKDSLIRKQLIEMTGLPRTTIFDNLIILMKMGIVERHVKKINHLRGRSMSIWQYKGLPINFIEKAK